MKPIVIGLGEALWDMLPEGKRIGGAPANFAYHASAQGMDGRVVSAVGRDELGAEALSALKQKGLGLELQVVDFPTGTVEVSLDSKGVPQYEIRQGVAWDNIAFTDHLASLAREAKAVCWGTLAQRSPVSWNTINSFLDTMPDGEGRLKVFDMNLRQNFYTQEIVESSMKRCNILKLNDEELLIMQRMFGLESLEQDATCRKLMETYGIGMTALTCGVDGSYIFYDGGTSFLPTPRVTVADTVGAGDSFTATLIASLLKGLSVAESHKRAVETSAFVCSQHGAMPNVPENLRN